MIIGPIITKHPTEVVDLDFNFGGYLAAAQDSVTSWDVSADSGVQLSFAREANNVVMVLVAGGDNLRSYTVAADIRTAAGRVARQEALVRVRGEETTGQIITGIAENITVYIEAGYYVPGYFQDLSLI